MSSLHVQNQTGLLLPVRKNLSRIFDIGIVPKSGTSKIVCQNAPELIREEMATFASHYGITYDRSLGHFIQRDYSEESLVELVSNVKPALQKMLRSHTPGLVYGGNHCASLASMSAFLTYCTEQGLTPGLVYFDAHGDFHTRKTSSTNNLHGMVLSALIGDELGEIMQLGEYIQPFRPENIIHIGFSAGEEAEIYRLRESGISIIDIGEIVSNGISKANHEIQLLRNKVDIIAVSFDVDVIDYTVGTGTNIVNQMGLNFAQCTMLARQLSSATTDYDIGSERKPAFVRMVEIVEYEPSKDIGRGTLEIASSVAASALGYNWTAYEQEV